jgi:hypothetical protein
MIPSCLRLAAFKPVATASALLVAVLAPGEVPRLVLEEDFERYTNTAALREVWPQGTGVLDRRAPGGGQAMLHDGDLANRRADFDVHLDPSGSLVLTADLFDFGTNANRHVVISLRNRQGAAVEMGMMNDGGTYGVRTVGFGERPSQWTAFNPTQKSLYGWHRFQVVLFPARTVATLDLDINGKVDWTVTLAGAPPVTAWTEVRIGGLSSSPSFAAPVLVDNIRLEVVATAPSATTAQNPAAPAEASVSPSAESSSPSASEATTVVGAAGISLGVWWIMAALGLILALLVWVVFALRRSGFGTPAALTPASGDAPPATQAAALAELTEFAKQSLVQGLYEQRNALLETQKQAQQALLELEQRLAALHLPHPERIRAYERRIAELEKELETRGEEVRELTRATLLLVRRRLEEERGLQSRRDQFN